MSVLYPKAKENLLKGNIDMVNDTIKVALIDTGTYTYSAAHEFYSSVSGVVGTPEILTSKTVLNGVFDAANPTYSAVTSSSIEALIIYVDSGTASTSELIAYIDSGTGLPVTPTGGVIIITWDTNIFAL